jgi:hypothetical protein
MPAFSLNLSAIPVAGCGAARRQLNRVRNPGVENPDQSNARTCERTRRIAARIFIEAGKIALLRSKITLSRSGFCVVD